MPDVGDPVLTEEDGAEGGQQGEHAQRANPEAQKTVVKFMLISG